MKELMNYLKFFKVLLTWHAEDYCRQKVRRRGELADQVSRVSPGLAQPTDGVAQQAAVDYHRREVAEQLKVELNIRGLPSACVDYSSTGAAELTGRG